jgi:hypothetical protein
MESVHLFLTHGVPVWIPASAGVVTAAAMLFNTANTEKISNLVTYRKWKSLSSEEIVRINEAFAASSVRTKLLRGPKILFMATLYEIAFQGSVQGLIQGLFYLGNATHEFDIWKFLVAIGVGSIGESAFDAAQSAYQETRGASVPHAIRKANMMRIGTLASILSVLGTLKSSDGVLASEILLGTMVTTGISLNFYFRNTDRIKEVVLPVALGLETRTRDFLTGVRGLFKTAAKRSCDFLSRRNNDIGAP